MKFFLLIVMTLVVFGSLAYSSYRCTVFARTQPTTSGRTFFRVSGQMLGVGAGIFLMWTIESNMAPQAKVASPNPIAELDDKANELRNTDVPQLESKTYRERVRQATEK